MQNAGLATSGGPHTLLHAPEAQPRACVVTGRIQSWNMGVWLCCAQGVNPIPGSPLASVEGRLSGYHGVGNRGINSACTWAPPISGLPARCSLSRADDRPKDEALKALNCREAGAAVTSRCPRGPACLDGHRWSGSGLGARGRCSRPWSLSCLVISSLSPWRPGPPPSPAALLSSPRGPPSSCSPGPQDSRGSSREGSPADFPALGAMGWAGGRALGCRGRDGGCQTESINHAPLRSCLTHTSPTSCQ